MKDISEALAPLRDKIDAIDDQLIRLLNDRARIAQEVGEVKAQYQLKAYAPDRERQLLERLILKNKGPLSSESIVLIYKEIISASLALESPLQISYLGPEATFTHEATKRHFGLSAQLHASKTIPDVFADVERQRSEYGVVPIENSTEGVVSHTLDSFVTSPLKVCAEVLLSVSHHLVTLSGSMQGITKIYSHAQAIEQCTQWLQDHLPNIPIIDVSNMARAAQLAAEDATAAAISSDLAASMYHLHVAASHLDNTTGNVTRFLVIGYDTPPRTGKDRTSVMFSLKDEPGILFRALACFAESNINMSRIESRPSRKRAWEYLFFVDLDGHQEDEHVSIALKKLDEVCTFFKILGSYPQGLLSAG